MDRGGKPSMGCYQVRMDDFLEGFSGTWTTWGIMRDGVVFRHTLWGRFLQDQGFSLLPGPIAGDYKGTGKDHQKLLNQIYSREHQVRPSMLLLACGTEKGQVIEEYEELMGFPRGWTDLNA